MNNLKIEDYLARESDVGVYYTRVYFSDLHFWEKERVEKQTELEKAKRDGPHGRCYFCADAWWQESLRMIDGKAYCPSCLKHELERLKERIDELEHDLETNEIIKTMPAATRELDKLD